MVSLPQVCAAEQRAGAGRHSGAAGAGGRNHQDDLRSFEWYYLWRLCQGRCRVSYRFARKNTNALAFSPDGNTLALAVNDISADISGAGRQGVAEVRHVATGETWSTSAGSLI